jgi:hypothetical protein
VEFHAGLKTVERGETDCWLLPLRLMLLLMMMTILEGTRMKCLLQRTKCGVTA